MRVFGHVCVNEFSNSFVIAPDGPGEAIIVDPGTMDVDLLRIIEGNELRVRYVLITRAVPAHTDGLKTLLRVYDAEVLAPTEIEDISVSGCLDESCSMELSGFVTHVIHLPGTWIEGVFYQVGSALFAGDFLSAGRLGDVPQGYVRTRLRNSLLELLNNLSPDLYLFPGYGPPTTVETELKTNRELLEEPREPEPQPRLVDDREWEL